MATYDPTGETFADMAIDARDHAWAFHGIMLDALDRPLTRTDWLQTCAQAREARLIREREDG